MVSDVSVVGWVGGYLDEWVGADIFSSFLWFLVLYDHRNHMAY